MPACSCACMRHTTVFVSLSMLACVAISCPRLAQTGPYGDIYITMASDCSAAQLCVRIKAGTGATNCSNVHEMCNRFNSTNPDDVAVGLAETMLGVGKWWRSLMHWVEGNVPWLAHSACRHPESQNACKDSARPLKTLSPSCTHPALAPFLSGCSARWPC